MCLLLICDYFPENFNFIYFFKCLRSLGYVRYLRSLFCLFMQYKNLILFGPPGTGKTYQAAHMAVALAADTSEETLRHKLSRVQIRQQFSRYQQEGRIATVTFHQSFSYEDFVEGIKPFKNQHQELYYDVEDGIFKQICYNAAYALLLAQQQRSLRKAKDTSRGNYTHLHFEFVDYLRRMMQTGSKEVIFETPSQKTITLENINQQGTLAFAYERGKRTYTVSHSKLADMYRHFDDPAAIDAQALKDLLKVPHVAIYQAAFTRFKEFEQTRLRTYNYIINHRQLQGQQVSEEQYQHMKQEIARLDYTSLRQEDYDRAGNFVLLIDEINRGNVAGILGELITLIEADKRAGMPEATQTLLPYSRERFSIPNNLYIIGTMNTTDRSIEAMDAALRRRFHFKALTPLPGLLTANKTDDDASAVAEPGAPYQAKIDIDLNKLLTTLNHRLERLLDADHTIGHGYLMPVLQADDPAQALHDIFYQQILPLLQEFFFADARPIERVIGKAFFEDLPTSSDQIHFADTREHLSDDAYNTQPAYRIRQLEGEAFKQAVRQIYET